MEASVRRDKRRERQEWGETRGGDARVDGGKSEERQEEGDASVGGGKSEERQEEGDARVDGGKSGERQEVG